MAETDLLVDGSRAMGVGLPLAAAERLSRFMDELVVWKGRMNLSGLSDPADILEKMFLDSLGCLRDEWIRAGDAVVDVGSGAGFPGLVVAVAAPLLGRPCWVTLVESVAKKVRFLEHVIATLRLDNAVAFNGRSESLARKPGCRESFDVCVSRGVAELRVVLEFMAPLVKVGGVCLAMKGPRAEAELEACERALKELGAVVETVDHYRLPFGGDSRSLVVIRKVAPTSDRFPRRPGMAAKRPLGSGR